MNSKILNLTSISAYTIVPLVGLLFYGWDWRQIMIFYWLGNISSGLATVLDTWKVPAHLVDLLPKVTTPTPSLNVSAQVQKIIATLFFCIHYGMFTLIHGIFVFAIVSGAFSGASSPTSSSIDFFPVLLAWGIGTALFLLVKTVESTPPPVGIQQLWSRAYQRIVTLQLSIIFGAFLITLFALPSSIAILLVLVNFVLEVSFILRNKQKASQPTVG